MKRMMWTVIFNIFLYSCVIIDVPVDVSDESLIIMWVEVWSTVTRAEVMINVLSDVIFGVAAGVEITVVTTVAIDLEFAVTAWYDVDVLSDVMTALKLFCWSAFSCWRMTVLNCDRDLQTCLPSYHVWSSLTLPALPQFPNQEPLRPQQLDFPDFLMVPHLWHTELIFAVVVSAYVYVWILVKMQKMEAYKQSLLGLREDLATWR